MTTGSPPRPDGISVRAKLTLSFAGFLVAAGAVLVLVAFLLLRFIPEGDIVLLAPGDGSSFVPDRSDLLRALIPVAIAALLGLAVIGLGGGWLLAVMILRPLDRIADAARLAAAGSLAHRIDLPGPRDEFRELADVFDAMLSRLERHVDEQQRFAANASHELRTPLAITRTMLEVAKADPRGVDLAALLTRLERTNERAIDLTEALLALANAARTPILQESVDLAEVARDALDTIRASTHVGDIAVDATFASAPAAGNGVLLARVAGNLIHNAFVHNLDSGGEVWISTRVVGGRSILEVASTGDPIEHDALTTLVEPFQRGATRTWSAVGHDTGVGLGLAIASAIARAHDGGLTLTARDGGGLVVSLELPGTRGPTRSLSA